MFIERAYIIDMVPKYELRNIILKLKGGLLPMKNFDSIKVEYYYSSILIKFTID